MEHTEHCKKRVKYGDGECDCNQDGSASGSDGLLCLVTGKPVDEPDVCTCRCKNCWNYMCKLEEAAYCPHGFLVGCPTCEIEQSEVIMSEVKRYDPEYLEDRDDNHFSRLTEMDEQEDGDYVQYFDYEALQLAHNAAVDKLTESQGILDEVIPKIMSLLKGEIVVGSVVNFETIREAIKQLKALAQDSEEGG